MKKPEAPPSEKWTPLTIPRFVGRPARLFSAATRLLRIARIFARLKSGADSSDIHV